MARQTVTIPFGGQLIGQGYNSETGESVGTALTVESVFEDTSADAQTSLTSFEMVSTQDSLLESLGVSASIDGRIGLFSGGAKMTFSEAHAVNAFSTYVSGRSFIQNAIRHGKGLRLTDEAKTLLSARQVKEFKKAFGDMFVRSLLTGGEFCVVARITSISEEHQTKVAAALHSAYNGLTTAGELKASLETAVKETSGRTDVSVKMLQMGGQGRQLAFTGPDAAKIIQRLEDLPAFVHEHAGAFHTGLASYETLPLPVPPEEENEARDIVLRDCAAQKHAFLQAISSIRFALEPGGKQMFANLPNRNELVALETEYRKALNALMAHAIRVSTGRLNPPAVLVLDPPPPPILFGRLPFTASRPKLQNLQGIWFNQNQDERVKRVTIVPSDESQATVETEFSSDSAVPRVTTTGMWNDGTSTLSVHFVKNTGIGIPLHHDLQIQLSSQQAQLQVTYAHQEFRAPLEPPDTVTNLFIFVRG